MPTRSLAEIRLPPPLFPSSENSRLARTKSLAKNRRLRQIASYIFWGAATTFVNFFVYAIATRVLGIAVVPASVLAWIVAILFAFFTNKIWVFGSKSLAIFLVLRELVAFIAARLTSGGIEIFMMWFFVDILGANDWLIKIAAGVFVVAANYVFSVVFIFKKKGICNEK